MSNVRTSGAALAIVLTVMTVTGLAQGGGQEVTPVINEYFDLIFNGNYEIAGDMWTPEALERSGQRGVLSSGWGGLVHDTLPASVCMVESIPHEWLFPRMAAVVHHGGAGTTGASLSAGVPSVVTPVMGDQPFWGRRVHELGVGPKPIMRRRLTADHLAEAITQAMTDGGMRERARALGEKIRAEDGVATAVQVLEQEFGRKGLT